MKIYTYANCDTCRKALKYLDAKGVARQELPIREQPPTPAELKRMLAVYGGDVRRLFNVSGRDYKALDMKAKLPKLTAEQALELLSKNGNLVKRPFVLTETGGAVGFKEEEWDVLLAGRK